MKDKISGWVIIKSDQEPNSGFETHFTINKELIQDLGADGAMDFLLDACEKTAEKFLEEEITKE